MRLDTDVSLALYVVAALCLALVVARRPTALLLGLALVASVAGALAAALTSSGGPHNVDLTPLVRLWRERSGEELAGDLANLLLLSPFAAVLTLRRWSFGATVAAGATFSIAIEAAQRLVPGRTTATDDVLLNTVGVALTYAVFRHVAQLRHHHSEG